MKTYRIIPAYSVPGESRWELVGVDGDAMDVDNVSHHATEEEARDAKSECERRDSMAELNRKS